ncbi:hypothetical protein BT69DRAFT_1302723, partial [Atractiella rhizophila]
MGLRNFLPFTKYIALTIWNVLTQGYNSVFTSILLPSYTSDDSTQCSPVQLNVGSLFYTQPQGTFNWALNSVTKNLTTAEFQTGFGYKGITYYYGQQSFVYGVCANCS